MKKGFTIIELMVVIAIINFLATIIFAELSNARTKSMYSKAQSDMVEMRNAIVSASLEQSKQLGLRHWDGDPGITGNAWTQGSCAGLDNRHSTGACYTDFVAALRAIESAANGTFKDLIEFSRDPWGSPYGLDENELEDNPAPAGCVHNTLSTFGPDGIPNTADDLTVSLPFTSTVCE